jgi:uncharacterized membrane protein
MVEGETDEVKLTDLKHVYDILEKDAKEMSIDLLNGVSMWRSASIICFILAALAAVVGIVVVTYFGVNQTIIKVNVDTHTKYTFEEFKLEVILIGSFLFGLAAIAFLAGTHYHRRFGELRRKYSELRATLEKLS